jgi:hypothetical protein
VPVAVRAGAGSAASASVIPRPGSAGCQSPTSG